MISLILPYWDRQEIADKALAMLQEHYSNLDMEIIIVDDGNAVPFRVPPDMPNVRVVTLPRKREPKAPTTAWNVGVREAKGDIVVLSCVEILHTTPVIEQLVQTVIDGGPKAYALAAAWCPEFDTWHCHSTVELPYNCKGTGLSFCSAMYKSLYEKAGGFDEIYREGAGYEDCDFINRLLSVGTRFIMRDDLVVIHPKTGAHIPWPSEKFERNRAIFFRKWPESKGRPINIICLKAGTAYGPDYVNILFDMVKRNLTDGFPGQFHCITDDPTGLAEGIKIIPLPEDLETWWGKLYMFKKGLFPDGDRCLFMDLDTLIVGNIDEIA